ncbi:Imidazoleglycerol-phosphate dehydratase [Candidatus Hodgkinia cicadicola]|nr:Imidazoleglycerol-phosphate dehydratase [Candidatus Hodgkinia cicadicola]
MGAISLRRVTLETDVVASLCVCGAGYWGGATSVGFLDHLLAQFAAYSLADLKLFCCGDLWTGWHHIVEDIGIVLGMLILSIQNKECCSSRFSAATMSNGGSLLNLSIDFSGRPRLYWDCKGLDDVSSAIDDIRIARVFFDALTHNCGATVHIVFAEVDDWYHAAEALFRAFGVCFRLAFGCGGSVSVSTRGEPKLIWR